jgi:hypothetical protein
LVSDILIYWQHIFPIAFSFFSLLFRRFATSFRSMLLFFFFFAEIGLKCTAHYDTSQSAKESAASVPLQVGARDQKRDKSLSGPCLIFWAFSYFVPGVEVTRQLLKKGKLKCRQCHTRKHYSA